MKFHRARTVLITLLVFLAAAVGADDRSLYEEGERRFLSGTYELAIERFERLIDEYPQSGFVAQGQLRIAQSMYYLGKLTDARERLDRLAVRSRSGSVRRDVFLWTGLTSFRLNDYERAISEFSAYIEATAGDVDASGAAQTEAGVARASLYRALALVETGQPGRALGDLEYAVARVEGAERDFALAALLEVHAQQENHDALLAAFDQWGDRVSATGPYREQQIRLAADAASALDRREQAVALYTQLTGFSVSAAQWGFRQLYAIAQDEGDRARMDEVYRNAEQRLAAEPQRLADFWFALGADAVERDRLELAEFYLSRLWDVRTERTVSGNAAFLFARAIAGQNRPAEALDILLASLTDPGVTGAGAVARRLLAARLLTERGSPAEAQELLERLPERETDAQVLYAWSVAAYRAGDGTTVLEVLNRNESQPLIREEAELARLYARVLLEFGAASDAVRAYRNYFAARSGSDTDDVLARFELVRALVAAGQFGAARQEASRIPEDRIDGALRDELAYTRGLAAFNDGAFGAALESFATVPAGSFEPLRSYHVAWSQYRTGDVSRAGRTMAQVVDELPSELAVEGRYLLAWTEYQQARYSDTRDELLRALTAAPSREQEQRIRALLATAYLADGLGDDALAQYRALLDLARTDEERANAWSRVADTLSALGRSEQAVVEYDDLAATLPRTERGRLALIDAGQILFTESSFDAARDRFRRYRTTYPDGADIDRALYWGGAASVERGESARALLWWEPLITEYPRSTFAPEAIYRTALVYEELTQRRRALEFYDRLVAAFPAHPRAAEADRRRQELRLALGGLTDREAELLVALETPGALERGSEAWFDAVLELGQIAIREQISLTTGRTVVVDFLIEAAEFNTEGAAAAHILLAEFYRRRGEMRSAVTRYIRAAGVDGATDEQRAQALYELAGVAREMGDQETARDAVRELQSRYPDSVWADSAAPILEALQ